MFFRRVAHASARRTVITTYSCNACRASSHAVVEVRAVAHVVDGSQEHAKWLLNGAATKAAHDTFQYVRCPRCGARAKRLLAGLVNSLIWAVTFSVGLLALMVLKGVLRAGTRDMTFLLLVVGGVVVLFFPLTLLYFSREWRGAAKRTTFLDPPPSRGTHAHGPNAR
jgi:hypothetical protein